jgi:uncharacterized protein YukE
VLARPEKEPKRGFILPFTTSSTKRPKDLTKNMEMAAILYLAESERKKRESRVLRKTDEKLVFVTKAFYPIWLIPFRGATLIFDGRSYTSHTLFYDKIPDIETFNKNLRANRKKTESYTATLIRNKDCFKNFSGQEEIRIEGLIANSELIEDFKVYLHKMKKAKRHLKNKAVLPNTIDGIEIREGIGQLLNLRKKTANDIQTMENSMHLLSKTTVRKIKTIQTEIRKTHNKYHRQIEKIKPKVKKEIWRIQRKYNRKIARQSKRFKKELQRLHKNLIELQKTLRNLKAEAKRCKTKLNSKKSGKKIQWKLKLKRIEKKLPTYNSKIDANIKKSRRVESALKLEIAQQKMRCDEHVEAANSVFLDLQASRDAEITVKRREIDTLENLTREITSSMREMIHAKRGALREFNKITVAGKKRSRKLVCLPFYLARYEKGDKKRYVVYPPALVEDMGILTKMKGALGAAKLKSLLQCRSKAITVFLNQLVAFIEKNPVLEKDITEAGIQDSILLKKRLRVGIKKGLLELEKQDWISKSELQAFSKILYIYTDAALNPV